MSYFDEKIRIFLAYNLPLRLNISLDFELLERLEGLESSHL